jgi:DNA-binding NtrC family response regulator
LELNLGTLGTPKPAVNPTAKTEERPPARLRKTARILVVDDEAQVRTMIGATLERQGYEVELADSAREALDALELNIYELVLTDIVMQGGNGIALLERIHELHPSLTPCAAAPMTIC